MSPTHALLEAFAARANRPLAQRQLAAETPFAVGHRHPELLAALQGALT
jgi:hypothetical protein